MKIPRKELSEIVRGVVHERPGRDLNYENPQDGKYFKSNCYTAAKTSSDLHKMIRDNDDIPAWCQVYVGIASAALTKVRDYLSYKINNSGEDT